MPTHKHTPGLVPELSVRNLQSSLNFYTGLCGFKIKYSRPEDGFAYICKDDIHLMLDQIGVGRDWITAEIVYPFGRGINLEMGVADLETVYANIVDTPYLYLPMEEKWYRVNSEKIGVKQFLCQDPDGYLLRFQRNIGSIKIP